MLPADNRPTLHSSRPSQLNIMLQRSTTYVLTTIFYMQVTTYFLQKTYLTAKILLPLSILRNLINLKH